MSHASTPSDPEGFSYRAGSIQPSGVRKMFEASGPDAVQFGLGEPDFQPPDVAIDAFHRAMRDGHNKYTASAGMPALREAIAASWAPWCPGLGAENVCIAMSGTNALLTCALTLLDPGDNVLIPDPGFVLYGPHAMICGAEARRYACRFERGFVPAVEDLEALVDARTKALYVCFPSNPTGAALAAEQRDELVAFARRHGLWIVTDEVYDRMLYDRPHVSFVGAGYERVLMANSFSKTFAMTGWRIGYVLGEDAAAVARAARLQYYVTACPNDAMQYGVLAALESAADYPSTMMRAFRERRDRVVAALNAMPGVACAVPEGAFYAFPRVDVAGLNSADLAMELLAGGVVVSPGTAFGPAGEGHLRLAFTTSMERIEIGLERMANTLASLADAARVAG